MGHHLTKDDEFKSDLFNLPVGYVAVKVSQKNSAPLLAIADIYQDSDSEFASDLRHALMVDAIKKALDFKHPFETEPITAERRSDNDAE